ncbi:MAG: PfkB family carbohydrate kinase, partial [Pseudomonadota bacterium]
MPAHIISIGECMVELARTTDDAFRLAYGGDTFNTAVYLARLADVPVAYATALGADPYSDAIVAIAEENRVGTELIVRAENRMPGLYLIETEAGERTFWYWRETAPARDYLRLADRARLAEAFASAQFIYLSGITLSLYDASAREELGALIDGARKAGTRVVMDSNFRPRGWPGDRDATRKVFADFWQRADIALP